MFELILVSCDCMDLNQSNTQLKAPSTCIRIYLKTLNDNATFQKHSTWRNFIDVPVLRWTDKNGNFSKGAIY